MSEQPPQGLNEAAESDGAAKLVPVAESIKYRRRAQQAEQQLQQFEQQLKELRSQLERHSEELASAEAQRDEANHRLLSTENRFTAERLLLQAGVNDLETAALLLAHRVDLNDELDSQTLQKQVEQLLVDKPFLQARLSAALPPRTASARPPKTSLMAQLTRAAQQAAGSGNRRDVAEYLRLRRKASLKPTASTT